MNTLIIGLTLAFLGTVADQSGSDLNSLAVSSSQTPASVPLYGDGGSGGQDGGEPTPPYVADLDGPLSDRLQAIAFACAEYDPTSGTVVIPRTEDEFGTRDSWIEIDLSTGNFIHVNPDCTTNGFGTIYVNWVGDDLEVTLDGQLCPLSGGNLAYFGDTVTLTVGENPSEVDWVVDGDPVPPTHVGVLILEAYAYGSWSRPIDEAIQTIGEWNDLLGMAAAMVATHDGSEIRHPNYEAPMPPPPPSREDDYQCENPDPEYPECVWDCEESLSALIQAAEFQVEQAEEHLTETTAQEWARYRENVRASRRMKDSCLDTIFRKVAIESGIEIVVGTGTIVAGACTGVGCVVIVGTIGAMDGALIATAIIASSSVDGCNADHYWRVRVAQQMRIAAIQAAESALESARDALMYLLGQYEECPVVCCPPGPVE